MTTTAVTAVTAVTKDNIRVGDLVLYVYATALDAYETPQLFKVDRIREEPGIMFPYEILHRATGTSVKLPRDAVSRGQLTRPGLAVGDHVRLLGGLGGSGTGVVIEVRPTGAVCTEPAALVRWAGEDVPPLWCVTARLARVDPPVAAPAQKSAPTEPLQSWSMDQHGGLERRRNGFAFASVRLRRGGEGFRGTVRSANGMAVDGGGKTFTTAKQAQAWCDKELRSMGFALEGGPVVNEDKSLGPWHPIGHGAVARINKGTSAYTAHVRRVPGGEFAYAALAGSASNDRCPTERFAQAWCDQALLRQGYSLDGGCVFDVEHTLATPPAPLDPPTNAGHAAAREMLQNSEKRASAWHKFSDVQWGRYVRSGGASFSLALVTQEPDRYTCHAMGKASPVFFLNFTAARGWCDEQLRAAGWVLDEAEQKTLRAGPWQKARHYWYRHGPNSSSHADNVATVAFDDVTKVWGAVVEDKRFARSSVEAAKDACDVELLGRGYTLVDDGPTFVLPAARCTLCGHANPHHYSACEHNKEPKGSLITTLGRGAPAPVVVFCQNDEDVP